MQKFDYCNTVILEKYQQLYSNLKRRAPPLCQYLNVYTKDETDVKPFK